MTTIHPQVTDIIVNPDLNLPAPPRNAPLANNRVNSILDLPPAQMVDSVAIMANVLKDVIEKQKMFQLFNGKKYVTVDGWCTLGSMLSILPAEKEVHAIDNGWYAKVDLINKANGLVVGSASAICTRSERNWEKREEYAIRSMSITRATGKAYRLAFSWIMNMAGYQSTPAEEMSDEFTTKPSTVSKSNTSVAKEVVLFASADQAQLDKLNIQLDKRGVPSALHLDVALALEGKPFNAKSLDAVIKDMPIHG